MGERDSGWTRRSFLQGIGKVGGAAAVFETMTAMGLLAAPEGWTGPPRLKSGMGRGKRVLILGAGIGGLTAAYELSRAGYQVEILEAQDRPGGRSLTARRGSVVREESDAHGKTEQVCRFDSGLYLNMGPGRLPYHHRRVLYYCRELEVPLEIYVMETTVNLFQTERTWDGDPQLQRRVANDAQGYVAELLAKALRKGSLDEEVSADDRERLLCLLKVYGDLGANHVCVACGKQGACKECAGGCMRCSACGAECPDCFRYLGSTRSGCARELTVFDPCSPTPPLALDALLNAQFWRHRFYQPTDFEWQPTLFQPVGGMDQIVQGFLRHVGPLICYRSQVVELKLRDKGVDVLYRDGFSGDVETKRADWVISNIPLPILKGIKADFADDFAGAVARGRFAATCKVGWQANRRFWEDTGNQIYGGISWIDHPITQMWYPSYDYFSAKGTMTGAYNYDDTARAFGALPLHQRLVVAREGAVRLHPEFNDPDIVPPELGMSIAWHNVPFQKGGWAEWDDSPQDADAYERLLAPDRRFHVVGDQVSTLPGWQEGAMMSAEHVIEQIAGLRPLTVPDIRVAPQSKRLVQGRF
jgi:monoamine oxidase